MQQPPREIEKVHALPELASALRESIKPVVARWRKAVEAALPQADELTRRQLENSIPRILKELAAALECEGSECTTKLVAEAPEHGELRFDLDFDLNELLIEYQLLRIAIVQEMTTTLGRDLTMTESVALNSGLDIVQRQAAVEFARHQASELTAEADMTGKYLSYLSHDLRGGLHAAILNLELVKRDLMKSPQHSKEVENLNATRRSMLETAAMMDRLLFAERLRRGKMPVQVQRVVLPDLFCDLIRSAQLQMQECGRVDVQIEGPDTIAADRDALTVILQNLLSNAIKYSQKPVTIRAVPLPDGGTRISVIDAGPGIAPDRLETLFQPFNRGETHGKKGVGLGLSIARQAADLIEARLQVDSKIGQGTQFHLDLPFADVNSLSKGRSSGPADRSGQP